MNLTVEVNIEHGRRAHLTHLVHVSRRVTFFVEREPLLMISIRSVGRVDEDWSRLGQRQSSSNEWLCCGVGGKLVQRKRNASRRCRCSFGCLSEASASKAGRRQVHKRRRRRRPKIPCCCCPHLSRRASRQKCAESTDTRQQEMRIGAPAPAVVNAWNQPQFSGGHERLFLRLPRDFLSSVFKLRQNSRGWKGRGKRASS